MARSEPPLSSSSSSSSSHSIGALRSQFIAAFTGSFVATLTLNPVTVVKIRLQSKRLPYSRKRTTEGQTQSLEGSRTRTKEKAFQNRTALWRLWTGLKWTWQWSSIPRCRLHHRWHKRTRRTPLWKTAKHVWDILDLLRRTDAELPQGKHVSRIVVL